jgi:hypothetical protein
VTRVQSGKVAKWQSTLQPCNFATLQLCNSATDLDSDEQGGGDESAVEGIDFGDGGLPPPDGA